MRSINRRQFAAGMAAIPALTLAAPPVIAKQPIIIKFSHVAAMETPKGRGAEKFRQLAETYTNGDVKVEVYANSSLYKDKEELEALQLGAVQMLAPSVSKFGPLGVREFEALDLPFLVPDNATLRRVLDGGVGESLLDLLTPKGVVGLGYWDNGFKMMHANRPLRVPADFRGLKLRIQSSKVLDAQMRALGAIPQVMAFSEVYQGLQTGVIDGGENPPSNVYTQNFHDVQRHGTLSNHGFIEYAFITNTKFWGELTPDLRTALTRAAKEANAHVAQLAEGENAAALAGIKATNKMTIIELTEGERRQWASAVAPVYEDMAKRVGKSLIDKILAISGGGPNLVR